jgi:hypothetical protein
MTPEEYIQVADEQMLAHNGNALTDIQRMILRESLAGKSYESMEGYATQHIKNEGKKLWDLLSWALGEEVRKTNFKGALEKRLLKSANKPSLSSSLLDVIEPSKQRAKRQDVVYKVPFLLIALLQDEYSPAKECFDEYQEGLANQIIENCERWIQRQGEKQGSDRFSFREFQWKDLENVKLAEEFAEKDNSQEVLKKHLLLGTLQMESSSVMKQIRESLLNNNFNCLLDLIEKKPLQQWIRRRPTPDSDMF